MKKMLQILKLNLIKNSILVLFFVYGFSITAHAQLQNNGILHVAANSYFYISSGSVSFGNSSATTTNISTPYSGTDGKIILGSASSFTTDGTAPKFVNGYAETKNTAETLLAIGAATTYAPVKVTSSAVTGVHATYINSSPLTAYGSNLDASVTAVANTEYWLIKGADAIVTLSWRASSGLSSYPYADATIVGYKNGKWEAIPSAIDATSKFGGTSSLSGAGSITSSSAIALSTYDALAIGKKGVSCFPDVIASGTKEWFGGTWDGTGWNGVTSPIIQNAVTLYADYNGPGFECYSLNLQNYNVTLTSGTLEVVGNITGTGKIILNENEGLVQHISTATKPQIELTRTTRTGLHKFDYVYWGSPVTENVFSQLNTNAIAVGSATSNAFDLKYKYVSGDTGVSGGWQTLTSTEQGKGFIMRIADQAPFAGSGSGSINMKFTGTANNGDVTVPVSFVNGTPTSARNNNLLANPYPSAIDADKFLTENSSLLDGVIYLWKAQTPNDGAAQLYAVADYIAYTKAGTTADLGTGSDNAFTGKIASGQGFKVKALGSGNALFTNCMRVAGSNSQFYRMNDFATNTSETIDRFKVNLQTSTGIANQVLVAYLPQTTLAYDYMYDAELYSVSSTKMYSILDNDTKKLAINARPAFDDTDEVTVGFTKETTDNIQMSFNIVEREGLFASNQTPIYLHDTQLNIYHNFANGAYIFTTTVQEDNNRFKIVYNAPLKNNDYDVNNALAALNNNVLEVQATSDIQKVQVFDLTGRLILTTKPSDNPISLKAPFYQASGVYIVKIDLTNGEVFSQKLLQK